MSATVPQPHILLAPPPSCRFLTFSLRPGSSPAEALKKLGACYDERMVIGLGAPLVACAGAGVNGLRPFPDDLTLFPATQHALWVWVTHESSGDRFDVGRKVMQAVRGAFSLVEEVDAFAYRGGRDLSGFEDGTENPKGDDAVAAAIISGRGVGLDGGSFVAIQRWVHDLGAVEAMRPEARAAAIGRDLTTNDELEDAPPSAHVKRTAQESFDPPSHILRRSMPYGGVNEHGLYFVAFGESLDRFERLMRRMAGQDDGIPDGLFAFARAVTGGYYFCPPVVAGRLDLAGLFAR